MYMCMIYIYIYMYYIYIFIYVYIIIYIYVYIYVYIHLYIHSIVIYSQLSSWPSYTQFRQLVGSCRHFLCIAAPKLCCQLPQSKNFYIWFPSRSDQIVYIVYMYNIYSPSAVLLPDSMCRQQNALTQQHQIPRLHGGIGQCVFYQHIATQQHSATREIQVA